MSESLRWAHRFRLELAVEIEQLASGGRKVLQVTANGPVDVTEQSLAALQERFAQVEKLIDSFGPAANDR
jgi:hypothetical protein